MWPSPPIPEITTHSPGFTSVSLSAFVDGHPAHRIGAAGPLFETVRQAADIRWVRERVFGEAAVHRVTAVQTETRTTSPIRSGSASSIRRRYAATEFRRDRPP